MSNLGQALLIPAFSNVGGSPTPPLPTVANLALWYDASKISGLSDGMSVAQWDDLSGGANHAVQATGTRQPLYKANIQNGRAGLLFDSVDDNLRTALAFTANVPGVTIFAVARSGINNGIIVESGTVWNVNMGFVLTRDVSDRVLMATMGAVGNSLANSGSTTISVTRLLTGVYDKSLATQEVKIYSDGVDKTATVTDSNNLDNILTVGSPLNFGSRNAGASNFLNGYLHEILIYLRALPVNERQSIEGYLRTKWRAV